MIEHLRITILVENTAEQPELLAEHGLAMWIEADGRNILFDTGQGPALAPNAETLGINLADAHDLVLSHGHYDHTGGLAAQRDTLCKANLYVHPDAFASKFGVIPKTGARFIGAALGSLDELRQHIPSIIPTPGPTEIVPGVSVTGEIPRRNNFEDVGGPFFLDEDGAAPDAMTDDQALYIETEKGMVVLLGCAHAGLVNTLDYIAELSGQRRFHAVLGGMHLIRASDERISRSIDALRTYDVQVIGPCHCTGPSAADKIRSALPDRFLKLAAGVVVSV